MQRLIGAVRSARNPGDFVIISSVGLLAIWLLLRPLIAPAPYITVSTVLQILCALLAGVLCISGGWAKYGADGLARSRHLPSILIGLSSISYAIGTMINAKVTLLDGGVEVVPSVADIAFLLCYPLYLAGLLLLPRRSLSLNLRTRVFLDSIMIMLAAVAFSWYFALGPIIEQGSGVNLTLLVSFAYPLGDLILACCLFLLISPLTGTDRHVARLLVASSAIMIMTNTFYAFQMMDNSYQFGGILDLLWAASHGLSALAIRAAGRSRPIVKDPLTTNASSSLGWTLLPYAFLPAVGGLVFYSWRVVDDQWLEGGVFLAAGALVGTLLLRQVFVIIENWRLQRIATAGSARLERLNDALQQARDELVTKNQELTTANEQLETLATTDPLTGLPNHRAIAAIIETTLTRVQREAQPCAILFFDLDHFKALNDSYGHATGDAVLRELATIARSAIREKDQLGRWGGEEFVVILPGIDQLGAQKIAERLRSTVAHHTFTSGGGLHLTCSIGLASAPHDGNNCEDLIIQADRAMYMAKQLGRNRFCSAAELPQATVPPPHETGSRESTSLEGMVEALTALLTARDSQAKAQDEATATLASRIAVELGMTPTDAKMIGLAGRLRDVGAVAVPDAILRKPEQLTGEEWANVRTHAAVGAATIGQIPALRGVAPLIRAHHERWDGQGYPDRLSEEEIPFGARIVAVADAFIAMTSARPYRGAREIESALDEIRHCAGAQFDPLVVAVLDAIIKSDIGLGEAKRAVTSPHSAQTFTGDDKIVRYNLAGQQA